MAIYKIQKRNWAIVSFDKKKIETSIEQAIQSLWGSDFSEVALITKEAINILKEKGNSIPDIESIQDAVEESIVKAGHDELAKSFILYREKRRENREDQKVVIEVAQSMDEYLDKSDWRVNANANSNYSLGGLILNTSGKVTANYWLSHIYPKELWNLHRNADIHIHDLDMFCGYCAGWSLRQLLEEWFNGLSNRIDSAPANNLQSAVNQMINFLGTLQNEWAGAQAFSSFDTYLAPFVNKYRMWKEQELDSVWATFKTEKQREEYIYKKTYDYVYQQMQNFIFGLNVPSRWGTQTPFTNITLDWTCPDDLKDKALYLGWMDKWPYEKTYGELEKDMKIINRALIDVYVKWDRKWRVFTFPIPTYNITEDFPWEDPDIDALFEMTAKYGLPYFQNFVWSQFKRIKDESWEYKTVENPDAYKPWSVRSMCCRLQLDLTQLEKRWNGLFGSAEMTGSIGVVTLNLARLGYDFQWDMEGLKKRIDYLMYQAKTSLELKRKVVSKWLKEWLYPYTYRYLRSFRNHFSTIGINGMNEAIQNFTKGKEDVSTEMGYDFSVEILDFMRDKLKEYQEETGNLYNLEATPAEGTTYRFAREDKKQKEDIIQAGTQEAPYYTNSSQLPVWYTDDAFEALEKQNELQCKYTGGTVLHLYMQERLENAEACKSFVKNTLSTYQLPYITISPTFSICPEHGYLSGEHDFCPKCDEKIGYKWEQFDIQTRETYTDDTEKLEHLKEAVIS